MPRRRPETARTKVKDGSTTIRDETRSFVVHGDGSRQE